VTTQDDLYASDYQANIFISPEAKEVYRHSSALLDGYRAVKKDGFLSQRHMIDIFQTIENINTGFRQTEVYLRDEQHHIIYTPPAKYDDITQYMANLEKFINNDELYNILLGSIEHNS
jgi:Fic family protein